MPGRKAGIGRRTQNEAPSPSTFYTWDAAQYLVAVEPPAGAVTLAYDAAGKRVQKETPTQTKKFLYDFDRLLQESDGDDVVQQTYTSTLEQYGELLSQFDGTDAAYHQYDGLGSTDALLDEAELATDEFTMSETPTFVELKSRIQRHKDFHQGVMPDDLAIAWYGYLAALIEWDLVSVSQHESLCRMLPTIENNPSVAILLGKSQP